jgi:hypothetical protein
MTDRLCAVSEGVQRMCNENSNAQNNQKCGDSFKHRRILRNRRIERSIFCTVKEIPLSGLNFPPRDDFEQHLDGVQSVVLISR